MKTIKKLPYMVALSLASLIGCREAPYVEKNVPQYQGYDVMVQDREIKIGTLHNDELTSSGFDEVIYGVADKEGNITQITLHAPKGSKLEQLASVQKVEEIYKDIINKRSLPVFQK